jgi:hypothetical protein
MQVTPIGEVIMKHLQILQAACAQHLPLQMKENFGFCEGGW